MTVTSTPPATRGAPRPPRSGSVVLALMSACVTLAVALVAAINLAVPKLAAGSLHPTSTQLLWIVDAYVIVFACLLIPAGAFGDRHGRKGALLGGLAVFAAGCVACALSPTPELLIAGRALTGVGAALIMPATLSLAMQSAPPERRAHTIAVWTAATGAAGILGNIGGGLALEYLPWQGLFWCVAPIALALLALAARLAPRGERHEARADPLGTALLVLGFVSLLFGLIEGPERGWSAGLVLGGFAVAAVGFAAFVAYGLRAAHPLIDPRVFAVPEVRAGVLGVAMAFFGLFGLFFVNAQYLQYAKGYSPVVAGVAVLPLAAAMLLVSRRSVGLAARFGRVPLIATGLAVIAGGLIALSFIDAHTPYVLYACVLVVMATGMGLSMPALSGAIIGALPPSRAGLGSGLNSAAREIGSALGVAVMGTVLTGRFSDRLPKALEGHASSTGEALTTAGRLGPATHEHVVTVFTDAMRTGFLVLGSALAVVTVAVVVWFRQPRAADGTALGAGRVRR